MMFALLDILQFATTLLLLLLFLLLFYLCMSCALFELRYHCTAEKSTFEFGLVNQALASAYRTLIKVL